MDLDQIIKKGMTREETFQVAAENAAIHVGSGSSPVLATPWMIAFMERVSHRLLAEYLLPGETSVGIFLEINHLAPTPVGASVRVQADVAEVAGNQVTFNVQAWDHIEKVGEGVHRRAVINEERFLRRVKAKQ
ncbi:MAG: thioesterase family protein [Anaerolineales bacterium]|nr:thioesterase family protein [Anaerolineales bacterium]